MSERKVTECWAFEDGVDGSPSSHLSFETKQYPEQRQAVMQWRTDYDALLAELAEYKTLIKVCDRCNVKECAEFVYPGKDGLEYCQTCYDDMFPREWGE